MVGTISEAFARFGTRPNTFLGRVCSRRFMDRAGTFDKAARRTGETGKLAQQFPVGSDQADSELTRQDHKLRIIRGDMCPQSQYERFGKPRLVLASLQQRDGAFEKRQAVALRDVAMRGVARLVYSCSASNRSTYEQEQKAQNHNGERHFELDLHEHF